MALTDTYTDELLFGGKSKKAWDAAAWDAASADLDDALRRFRPSAEKLVDEPKLLDIADIRDAFALMNSDRVQPKHDVNRGEKNGFSDPVNQCLYGDPATGRPSCIAGTVMSILAPDYFAQIKGDFGGVKSLCGLSFRFTQRAINLLFLMQKYADGDVEDRVQRTWGEAFHEAALDLLSA